MGHSHNDESDFERQQRERAERQRVTAQALRVSMGIVGALLDEPDMCEVMLNPDGKLWVERLGKPMEHVGSMAPAQAIAFLNAVASSLGESLNPKRPKIGGELPLNGERIQASIPPIVEGPQFAIRKPAFKVFLLDEYVARGVMTAAQADTIRQAVVDRKNIIVAGGTGSGKTTLCNAVLAHLSGACPDDRLVIIEDTRELQCKVENRVDKRTRLLPGCSALDLLKDALRERPDRILMGEVRDEAAFVLLQAWSTGHPGGVCTVHANSAEGALRRLNSLAMLANIPPQHELVAEAVNMVIYVERDSATKSRRVKEIVEVRGYDESTKRYIVGPV